MKKESKANLIFVSLLVCSMIPGIFMLVRKKLNGDMTSAALPDPVPFAVAYNQPPPFPPSLPRREPPVVREWVARLTQEKVGIDVSLMRSATGGPVVSDGYLTQSIAVDGGLPTGHGGSIKLWLLIWRESPAITASDPVLSPVSYPENAARVISLEQLPVPKDVRHALQGVGYIDPPQKIWLGCYELQYSDVPGAGMLNQIKIAHSSGQPRIEILNLP